MTESEESSRPGRVRTVIPASEGRGIELRAGDRFQCIDLEGRQCGDLFAFNVCDVSEFASAEHTRVQHSRLFPRVMQAFVTNRRRPILTFEEDRTPGAHDMLVAACDPARYRLLGVTGSHPSCQENLRKVMENFGHSSVAVPQPINLFTNIVVLSDGTLDWRPALTTAGDSVTLRAEMHCYIVLTACAQDILPINGHSPSSLAIDVL